MKFFQLDLFAKARLFLEKQLVGQRVRKTPAPTRKSKSPRKPSNKKDSPELRAVWQALQREYFPSMPDLLSYRVCWSSRRQLRTLASCSPHRRRINVAKELRREEHFRWLSPLLYHEMCHAVLADRVREARGAMKLHGYEFRQLERRHPLSKPFDQWIRAGGWLHAVRSDRSREAHARRKLEQSAA